MKLSRTPDARTLLTIATALLLGACSGTDSAAGSADKTAVNTEKLATVLSGDHRSSANKARDDWRNPQETLEFFGVADDKVVMEIWPGGGWYTEILAPYLRDSGTYIAAGWDPNSEIPFIRDAMTAFMERLAAQPDLYDQVQYGILMPPDMLAPAQPGSVDVVLTFRNIHNWMPRGSQGMMLAAIYDSLKPGGVLGVVEHRGVAGSEQDPKAASGYVNEDFAIAMIEEAGFVFEAKSEINANPADSKDHPQGVWTLPPTLRLKDVDRDKYLGIGESDRFTLRFRKPE